MPDTTTAISEFFGSATQPVLFGGAGLSVAAGLPDWAKLLRRIAESIRSKDPYTANQMIEAMHDGDLAHAATYWKITKRVTDVDKFAFITSELKTNDVSALADLVQLPFVRAVTTNFDRTLLQAYAKYAGKSPVDYRFGEPSFKEALWA